MAHVITDDCIKCATCTESCPSEAIHPLPDEAGFDAADQLYIDSRLCMDCGSCALACPTDAIYPAGSLPKAKADASRLNYIHFLENE